MPKRLLFVFEVVVALVALLVGYVLVTGVSPGVSPAEARSATMPANPHILYLAPAGAQRGLTNDETMQNRGATPSRDWRSAQAAAQKRPLDALLVDASHFETMTDSDRAWLRTQAREGVVIVALGLEDEQLAQYLGLAMLRGPGEGDVPIGPTGYRMIQSIILGQPDDVKILEANDWIAKEISGETEPLPGIQRPLVTSFGKARGELNAAEDLDLLFRKLRSQIEGAYESRAEYEQAVKAFEEK